jgi:ADP-heptose:LPS heptosyltransferase
MGPVMTAPRPRAILAIHPGALGDVLQALPALAALRALDGGSRVTLAAQPRIGRLLAGAGAVDAALPFDGLGLEHLFAGGAIPDGIRARLAAFDRVVSWFASRVDPYPERLRALVPAAIVARPVPDGPGAVWAHLLNSLAPWGIRPLQPPGPLAMPASWRAEAEATLARVEIGRDRPLLVVHPGAGGVAKRWPVEKMATAAGRVARMRSGRIVVHQGPADREPARALVESLAANGPALPVALLVEPPLETLAAVLQGSDVYLGSDSGISQLAAAVGASGVILFSPGALDRWTPWSPAARAVEITPDGRDVQAVIDALSPAGRDISSLDSPPSPA